MAGEQTTGCDKVLSDAGSRDYAGLRARLTEATRGVEIRETRIATAIELLWETIGTTGVSWLGIYTASENADEMILTAREPKPACSPIGLHGVCGRSFTERRAVIVGDVEGLGESYIACDPLDRSELVLPLFDEDGEPWGVLDLDSHQTDSFSPEDAAGLRDAMIAAGLTKSLDDGLSLIVI